MILNFCWNKNKDHFINALCLKALITLFIEPIISLPQHFINYQPHIAYRKLGSIPYTLKYETAKYF